MGNIIEASQLPEQDKVYLKKDVFGWRIVHPLKNPDGSINVWNVLFGGIRNFVTLLAILLILGMLLYGEHEMTKSMKEIVSNPCIHCSAYVRPTVPIAEQDYSVVNNITLGRVVSD
ncbi:hypothetical protein M0R04_14800 [Candidatus Dojkabacteria bacterium]|jgi:hypothetical protein|nr:hypothetical protein [Candidatus Dojkabacteria bacterium]